RADARNDDVAGLTELDRNVQHPVVARMQQNGHRAARHASARVDRPHIGLQEARAALCLVHGRDAELGKPVDDGLIGSVDVADGNVSHGNLRSPVSSSDAIERLESGKALTLPDALQISLEALPELRMAQAVLDRGPQVSDLAAAVV